ncbi:MULTISPECIES: FimB/Mfa2 family fimbrial subunit [unclassified Dysgonomonas]|uniref:FimB/Mfa2 family fimbrial subunit n=1 Tax=unclassified Dysgonomonas TaxID=2630389 RepID=UPI000683684B|nr:MULTISPECIES: FimB/Mfa2 family fimbrial subunit [unclassified Dysgonomonas]MBD8348686.1 hypothetical protein [Dysgonomonas sp. HGC4]MBF0576153.1 hypothetical protein [Dysgonomonas sp. GY617]
MKKVLFYLNAALLMGSFFSCSKDSEISDLEPTPSLKMQEVVFDLKGNEFEQVNVRSTSLGSSDIKSLHYVVYNAEGRRVKYKEFLNVNVSEVKDTLPSGNYKVVFIATNADDFGANFGNGFNVQYNDGYIRMVIEDTRTKFDNDVFFTQSDLTIGNSMVNKETVLSRVVGKVEVLPLDIANTPTDLLSLQLYVSEGFPNHFYFQDLRTVWQGERHTLVMCSPKYTRANFLNISEDNPIVFTGFPAKVESSSNYYLAALYYLKDTPNVGRSIILKRGYEIERNKTLRLSGNLFTGMLTNEGLEVDTEWGATLEESFD